MGQEPLVLTKIMHKVMQDEARIALYLMIMKLIPAKHEEYESTKYIQ